MRSKWQDPALIEQMEQIGTEERGVYSRVLRTFESLQKSLSEHASQRTPRGVYSRVLRTGVEEIRAIAAADDLTSDQRREMLGAVVEAVASVVGTVVHLGGPLAREQAEMVACVVERRMEQAIESCDRATARMSPSELAKMEAELERQLRGAE
jgi:hypothetical protein